MAVESRPYQERVHNNVLKAFDDGHRTILIESPTGSGKTVMGLKLAKYYKEKYGWKIGWTCMRKALVKQVAAENEAKFGIPEDYISFFSTFDKNPPLDVDMLIEDEGQHSASFTATALGARINPKMHLSLTATPFRTDSMKLCFSKVIKDAGVRQLIDEGWLAPYHYYSVDSVWTPEYVANLYANDIDTWGKSIMFFLTVQQCIECQQHLSRMGIESEVVHGGSDQEAQIRRFVNNEIDLLINVFVLTEGFDAPALKTVFCRPSSRGPAIQMAGRALRKHTSKENACIVQPGHTKWAFTRTASPEKKYDLKEGVWHEMGDGHALFEKARMGTMKAMFNAPKSEIPAFIKKNRGGNPIFQRYPNEDEEIQGGRETTGVASESVPLKRR